MNAGIVTRVLARICGLALLLSLLAHAACVPYVGRRVVVRRAPPPVSYRAVLSQPTPPRPQMVWVEGHYEWIGNDYVWVDGAWIDDRPGYVWVQPHWESTAEGYVYVPGAWTIVRTGY